MIRIGLLVGVLAGLGALLWAVMTTDMGAGPGNEDMVRKKALAAKVGADALVAREMDFRLGGMA